MPRPLLLLALLLPVPCLAQAQLSPTFSTPPPPAGMINTLPTPQGYLSTGVSSAGGAGVEAGALIPVAPGRVTLDVGGGTGQTPLYGVPSRKTPLAHYNDYHAALDAHIGDNMFVSVGVTGQSLRPPP